MWRLLLSGTDLTSVAIVASCEFLASAPFHLNLSTSSGVTSFAFFNFSVSSPTNTASNVFGFEITALSNNSCWWLFNSSVNCNIASSTVSALSCIGNGILPRLTPKESVGAMAAAVIL